RPGTRQQVTNTGITGDGGPGRSHRPFHETMDTDQLGGSCEKGAQNPVLDQPPLSRARNRTDNDKQQSPPNDGPCQPSGKRPPSPRVSGVQRARPIDVATGGPLLHEV